MSKRNIIISVVLACLLVTGAGFGAFYYWGTHHLDSVVPGKVYQYSSSLNGEVNNRVMYVAFQEGGNKALVSQDRTTVVNAAKSQTDFDKAYNDQTAKWEYSVTKTTLTLGKKRTINCHNGSTTRSLLMVTTSHQKTSIIRLPKVVRVKSNKK